MSIKTENGNDYLESILVKFDNKTIDASKFFHDAEEAYEYILKKTGKETIGFDEYGSKLSSLLKRFSGTYFSPSFMKGYITNPATTLFSSFCEEKVNDATAIGTTVHKIFEEYYKLPKKDRSRDKLDTLQKEYTPEGQDVKKVLSYINGYKEIKDYLNQENDLDDTNLDCFCEQRGKGDIYIPQFDITIPLKCSYVVDRVDIREDKLYILDYKTGYQTAKSASFEGYLQSMILYKWLVECEYSMEVAGGYLVVPQNNDKYIQLDYSLVNQSKCVEQTLEFCDKFINDTESRIYDYTGKGYFTNDDSKKFKQFMEDGNGSATYPVRLYLGKHDDIA